MKDLVGLRAEDVKELREAELIPEDALVVDFGISESGEQLYSICYDNSDDNRKAFDYLYGGDQASV